MLLVQVQQQTCMMSPGDTTHDFVATLWKVPSATNSATAPTALAADGTLWYNPQLLTKQI